MRTSSLLMLVLFLGLQSCIAQRGYTEQIRKEGLRLSTKWGNAKDADGQRKTALLIAVENTSGQALEYSYAIRFYYEGILRESGVMETECIESRKSKVGKVSGTYFIPEKLSETQIKSGDFSYEIDDFEVKAVDVCE